MPEGYTPCGAEVPVFLRDCRALSVQRNEISYVRAQNRALAQRSVDRLYEPACQLMRVADNMAHEVSNLRNMLAALVRVVDRQARQLDTMPAMASSNTMPTGNPRVTPVRLPGPQRVAPGAPWQKRVARRSKRGGVRHRIDLDAPVPERNDRKRQSDDDNDYDENEKRVARSADVDASPNSDDLWPESESD